MEVLIGFVAIAAFIVLVAWLSWYFKKKRQQAFATMARQLGLQYSTEDTFGLLGLPFTLFTRGDGRGCENVMWGTWQEVDLKAFDYWYYEERTDSEGRRSKTYYRFSCAVTEIPADCPPLSISREGLFTRLADHMGFRDIEFELEEFNRSFQVKGKDRKFANDLIDARMMQWLMGSEKGWSFEVVGRWLLCHCRRKKPAELVPLLGSLMDFRDHMPRVVWSLYGSGAAPVG